MLRINENKVDLFENLASEICKFNIQQEDLEPCTEQKGDGSILLRVADAGKQGNQNTKKPPFNLQGGGGGAGVLLK